MLKKIKADLHIHTCLSPCGDMDMTPAMIVEKARSKGLDVIGICDHNSSENVIAVRKAGEKYNLKVLGGMEVTSKEEVHILALFDEDKKLSELQKTVYENPIVEAVDKAMIVLAEALFEEQIFDNDKIKLRAEACANSKRLKGTMASSSKSTNRGLARNP